MASAVDLTGRWVGHYAQNDQCRPITAQLIHERQCLTGTMYDGVTERAWPLLEELAALGKPLSDELRNWLDDLRHQLDDAPLSSIECYSILPEAATLEGKIRNDAVSWRKRYDGVMELGCRANGKRLPRHVHNHVVIYRGRLLSDGSTIEGNWVIEARPDFGSPRIKDAFRLQRDSDGRAAPGKLSSTHVMRGYPWWQFWRRQ